MADAQPACPQGSNPWWLDSTGGRAGCRHPCGLEDAVQHSLVEVILPCAPCIQAAADQAQHNLHHLQSKAEAAAGRRAG